METFIISDTHFSHEKSWRVFTRDDGTPLRPFSSNEEMDNTMVENWNKIVKPNDRVIHLGDVAIHKKGLEHVSRLNGTKILVMGNHDEYSNESYYAAGFSKLVGSFERSNCILTHIPVHTAQLGRWKYNIHGHLHAHVVKGLDGKPDPRYFCASVEQIDYRPVNFEQILLTLKERNQ